MDVTTVHKHELSITLKNSKLQKITTLNLLYAAFLMQPFFYPFQDTWENLTDGKIYINFKQLL